MAQEITRKYQLKASIHDGFIIPGTAIMNEDRESKPGYEISIYCYIQDPDTRKILLKMKESIVTELIADFFTSRKSLEQGYYVTVAGDVDFTDQAKQFSILVTDFTLNNPDPTEIPEFIEAQLNDTGKDRKNSSLGDDILINEMQFEIPATEGQSQLVTGAKDILFNFDGFDTGATDDYYDDPINPTNESGLVSPESLNINPRSTAQLQKGSRPQKKIVSEENAAKYNSASLEENKEISKSPERPPCSQLGKDLMELDESPVSDEDIEMSYNQNEPNDSLQGDLRTLQNLFQDKVDQQQDSTQQIDTKMTEIQEFDMPQQELKQLEEQAPHSAESQGQHSLENQLEELEQLVEQEPQQMKDNIIRLLEFHAIGADGNKTRNERETHVEQVAISNQVINIELEQNLMDIKTMINEPPADEVEEEIIAQKAGIQPITEHVQPTTVTVTPTIDEHVEQTAVPDMPIIENQEQAIILDTPPIEHREQTAIPNTPFMEHGEKTTIPNIEIEKIVQQSQQVNPIQRNEEQHLLAVDQNNNTTTTIHLRQKRRRTRYIIPGVPPRRSPRLAKKPRPQYYPRKRIIRRRKQQQQQQEQQLQRLQQD